MLLGCDTPGAVVAAIIQILPIANPVVILIGQQLIQMVEELIFAKIAAIGRVGDIAFILELLGLDNPVVDIEIPGQFQGFI